jgi:dihydroorotate dehydrogenase
MLDYYPLAWPFLRALDPERAHRLAILALQSPMLPRSCPVEDPILRQSLWGRSFANPIGLAAGFDKNGEAVDGLLRQGFGFVEVGTVTLRPQTGNPRPRVFRLPEDGALINRLGFNNDGLSVVEARLRRRHGSRIDGLVGANVGPNRDSADPAEDCARGVAALAPYVAYLVVNVSSPNTPGLRDLQSEAPLRRLLDTVLAARDRSPTRPPLLVKIAPDLDPAERESLARVVIEAGIDGLVCTNTTVTRPASLGSRHQGQAGGLSGRPLFELSTAVLRDIYRLTGGRLPLIGVGGVGSGADAYRKIRAGASLVQLYTALVYGGPALATRIARELADLLRRDGLASIGDAIGLDAG